MTEDSATATSTKPQEEITDVVIRLAGDSGDGMQLTGSQFTLATAFAQNDLATLPDFPAEIRAPAGTLHAMDSLIAAAARALSSGDALTALKHVALREDPAALALRGIAMAQLGE